MKKKYKFILLLSNLGLFFFILNIFSGMLIFEYEKTNGIVIFICCLLNSVIAVIAAIKTPKE